MSLGNVVERHHHQREKQHGWNGANPIPVRRQNAILIGRCRPPHKFERAQVGSQKTQTCDPGGHLASRQEKVFAGLRESLQVAADSQDGTKIENNDRVIHSGKVHQSFGYQHRKK